MISARLATLHELDTNYGVADLYMLMEIVRVDLYNTRLANQHANKD